MSNLRFNGRVVVVTGAGAGLGRCYALLFAERGASVVVNDLGGGRHGEGQGSNAADSVVNEIKAKGGVAVADYNSVTNGEKIIETALSNFGRIDVLVNNAGILRDKSFARISDADWDLIHAVHLKGSFKTTQAAWPHFRKQNYGRIIMTSSNSGLYGNFGQANYSAAKMALVGLANTLAIEGGKNNIHCNVIVPTAGSRLTEDILPPDFFAELRPELIAPVVVWLCHEECPDNGSVIESAVGWASKYQLVRSQGGLLRRRTTDGVTPEAVQSNWKAVTDMTNPLHYDSIQEASASLMTILEDMKSNESTQMTTLKPESENTFPYTGKDSIIYALGVGASVTDPSNLRYLYENHEDFSVLPTFAILPGQFLIMSSDIATNAIPGKTFELSQALHGEQYIELFRPLSTTGSFTSTCKVADVLDKGKGAVIIIDVDSFDQNGNKIAYGQMTVFVVGAGGFGGKRDSPHAVPTVEPPVRRPDCSISEKTSPDQAALYRLSCDLNPLHIDPDFAQVSGFKRPILHGLCSLGFSARHVLKQYAGNDSNLCKAVKARFAKPVFPGETLKTDMWRQGNRIHFQTSVIESGNTVISGAYMDLKEVCNAPVPNPVAASDPELLSEQVFAGMKERVDANLEKVKAINGIFVYNITKGGKVQGVWTLDLKKGNVYKGQPEAGIKVDATVTVEDQDMVDIALGNLNPQSAFMKGKLKVKGNIMLVQKLKILTSLESKL